MPTPPAFVSTRECHPEDDPPAKPHNKAGSDEDNSTELSSDDAPGANQGNSPSDDGTSHRANNDSDKDNNGYNNDACAGAPDDSGNIFSFFFIFHFIYLHV